MVRALEVNEVLVDGRCVPLRLREGHAGDFAGVNEDFAVNELAYGGDDLRRMGHGMERAEAVEALVQLKVGRFAFSATLRLIDASFQRVCARQSPTVLAVKFEDLRSQIPDLVRSDEPFEEQVALFQQPGLESIGR